MADHDWRVGANAIDPQGRGNFNKQQEGLKGKKFMEVRYFDAAAVNMAAADTFKIMTFGAGVVITSVLVNVITAEGGTATMDIGDSASAVTFHDDFDLETTGVTATTATKKYYAAADYMVLLINEALNAAKFYVIVQGVRLV